MELLCSWFIGRLEWMCCLLWPSYYVDMVCVKNERCVYYQSFWQYDVWLYFYSWNITCFVRHRYIVVGLKLRRGFMFTSQVCSFTHIVCVLINVISKS